MNTMAHAVEALYARDSPLVSLMAQECVRAFAHSLRSPMTILGRWFRIQCDAAGLSGFLIGAWSGHKTLSEVARYTGVKQLAETCQTRAKTLKRNRNDAIT